MPEETLDFGDTNELAHRVRKAIGVGDYEEVRLITPQFDREDGKKVTYFPTCAEDLDALKKAPKDILLDLGLKLWCEGHYLFPVEWYNHIPNGYVVTSISDEDEPFEHGKTDDDRRFGMLAYGFKREEIA